MRLVKGGLLSNKKFKLRQHQADAIDAANDFFFDSGFENPRGIICLPTGGGKTVTAISFIVDAINNGKIDSCLWVVHREELCNQAVKTFNDFGIDAHKWPAKEKSTSNVTVCMLQSTRNITRSRKCFDLIVVDEAHHFSAEEEDYENTYGPILLVCNRGKEGYGGGGKPAHVWAKETIEELSKHTNRNFIIRFHKANSNDKSGDVKEFLKWSSEDSRFNGGRV